MGWLDVDLFCLSPEIKFVLGAKFVSLSFLFLLRVILCDRAFSLCARACIGCGKSKKENKTRKKGGRGWGGIELGQQELPPLRTAR